MQLFLLVIWFAVCAEEDARHRQISNWLTFGGFLLFLVYLVINGQTWLGASVADGIMALVVALLFTVPGYGLRRLGAGDVKLLAAYALATDSVHVLITFIGAGVTSLIWLFVRKQTWPHLNQWFTLRYQGLGPGASSKQPFAPFLFAGFVFCLFLKH